MMIPRPKTRLPLPQAITALALVVGTLVPQRGIAQEGVELQFVSFPKAGNPAPLELRLGDEKTIQVEMPTNRISETYSVDAMPEWTLGETVEDEEGEPVFRALANVRSLGTDKQLILVIRRSNNNQGGLRMIAIPNGESELGGGSFTMINVSGFDIGGTLSSSKFRVRPGQIETVTPEPSRERGVYQYCDVQFFYRGGDKARSFFTSTWRLNDRMRSIIFFYKNSSDKKLRMHSIRDFTQ